MKRKRGGLWGRRLTSEQQELAKGVVRDARRLARRYGRKVPEIGRDEFFSEAQEEAACSARDYERGLGLTFEVFAWARMRKRMIEVAKPGSPLRGPCIESLERIGSEVEEAEPSARDAYDDDNATSLQHVRSFAEKAAQTMAGAFLIEAAKRTAERQIIAREVTDAVLRAVGRLEPIPARIVTLHHLEGVALLKVAKILRMSYATVRRYRRQAVRRLPALLHAEGITEASDLE